MATDIIVGQLLENAFKYSPDGGTVTRRGRGRRGSDIVVTVVDEGIGIAAGDHERIFERFVQGEAGDRRRFGGIGLGLYIVKRLTEAQGGTISAHPAGNGNREQSHNDRRLSVNRAPAAPVTLPARGPNGLLRAPEGRGPAGGARPGDGTCMRLVLRAAG